MNCSCRDCKYCDIDYEWDDLAEDEIEIMTCQKGHEMPCDDTPCSDFKEYKPKPYKEEFSDCDNCEYVLNCENVIESTITFDRQRHFVKGRGYCQKKDGVIDEKKLTEIIQIADKLDFIDDNIIPHLNKSIEKFGDITWGEFINGCTCKIDELIKILTEGN